MPKLTPEQLAEIAESGHLHRYEGRNEQADIIFKALDHIKALEAEVADRESGIDAFRNMYHGARERYTEQAERIKVLEEENRALRNTDAHRLLAIDDLEKENARYKDTLSKIVKHREDDDLYDIIWAIAHEAIKPQNGVIADILCGLKGVDKE